VSLTGVRHWPSGEQTEKVSGTVLEFTRLRLVSVSKLDGGRARASIADGRPTAGFELPAALGCVGEVGRDIGVEPTHPERFVVEHPQLHAKITMTRIAAVAVRSSLHNVHRIASVRSRSVIVLLVAGGFPGPS
jgi:hypothetical protein